MKDSKEMVITGKMVVKAAMMIGLVAIVVLMGIGIYTGDARLIGEASLFACAETGYWSAITLEKRKNNSDKKNVVIDL